MMKKGVITVYFSLIFMLLLSFLLVLLESDRVYVLKTESERYADMAAEMVFAGYVQPLADQYDLLGVYSTEDDYLSDMFASYLRYNLENTGENNRLFQMYGTVTEAQMKEKVSFRDNQWQALKAQAKTYEEARAVQKGKNVISERLTDISGIHADEIVGQYCGQLQDQGEKLEAAKKEAEQEPQKESDEKKETKPQVEDPRKGITRWLKSGLLNLVMGDQQISDRRIQTTGCSWQTSATSPIRVMTTFDQYKEVVSGLKTQNWLSQIQSGLQAQTDQMILNLYMVDHFKTLRNDLASEGKDMDTALQYEIEYMIFGHTTDRENLESTMSACFTLRTLLNLAYLYLSPDTESELQVMADGILAAGVLPVAGQVLQLLLMIGWASVEAAVDCAGLAEGGKVPLFKDRTSWNVSPAQLQKIASIGGKASDYFKSSDKGWDYDQYLFLLLMCTSPEKKIIRMTQLIENNVWRIDGYEHFQMKNCVVKADFSGAMKIGSFFWQHPKKIECQFQTGYSY